MLPTHPTPCPAPLALQVSAPQNVAETKCSIPSEQLRILFTVCGFPPARHYGGPAVSVDNLTKLLSSATQCFVVTRNHEKGMTERLAHIRAGWNQRRDNLHVLYLPNFGLTPELARGLLAKDGKVRPDVIYLNSLLTADFVLPVLLEAQKSGVPVVIAPRGELCEGALSLKKHKKLPYLFVVKTFLRTHPNIFWHATSADEAQSIQSRMGVPSDRIFLIPNAPTLPDEEKLQEIHREKQRGELRLAFISRIHPKKNLTFALEVLAQVQGKVHLDVYGPIEDEVYWQRCLDLARRFSPNVTMAHRGSVPHEAIHQVFRAHHAFFFPTLSENYGHVIAEALFAACPILISRGTTPWDDVDSFGAGRAIALDDVPAFVRAIEELCQMDSEAFEALSQRSRAYAWAKSNIQKVADDYVNLFQTAARLAETNRP